MEHGWERDEIERLFCFASEASACCVEEGPRAQLRRGDFFWRAKRASVALKKGRGLGWASEASLCCFGQLARTGSSDARSRSEVQNLMLRWSRTTYKSDFGFFFWPKEGRKKRENNSIVNTKKNVSQGGVGFFWSGHFWLFLFKKRGFFFNLLPTPRAARARACARARAEVGNGKKTDFFWELKKIFTGSTVAF